jgi:hypothetical protein
MEALSLLPCPPQKNDSRMTDETQVRNKSN